MNSNLLGLGANLIGVAPEKGLKLAANEFIREWLENPDGSITLINEIISGAGAGIIQVNEHFDFV